VLPWHLLLELSEAPSTPTISATNDADSIAAHRMKGSALDIERFDGFTRHMAGTGSSRRQALRVLGAMLLLGTLNGVAAHLGLAETAAAKAKKPNAKAKQKRKNQAARKEYGPLRAAGKRKGKGKGKGKKHRPNPPPLLPPGCQNCTECQMCQDGNCVPDPALAGVRCLGSGATCGYCQAGQCAGSAVPACPDGTCPQSGQCCSGEKRCVDPESPTGFICLGEEDCCPDQKKCAGGCVYKQACCPEERPSCGQCGEICVNGTWQCSAQKKCADGSCKAQDECCPEEWTCADGSCVAQDQCCPEEKRCDDGSCISADSCCTKALPAHCHEYQEQVCCDGDLVCRESWDTPTCYPYGDWLEYNPNTCACECPADSVQILGTPFCCPADYPTPGSGHTCIGDVWNEWVCTLGYSPCEGYPVACCPDNWPPPPPNDANRDPGTAQQRDVGSAESHCETTSEPDVRHISRRARNGRSRERSRPKQAIKKDAGKQPRR
jgi:hypothetical protein